VSSLRTGKALLATQHATRALPSRFKGWSGQSCGSRLAVMPWPMRFLKPALT
jgi:hypothetical protein